MDDWLIELYLRRSEEAVAQTEARYGAYCRAIIHSILPDYEDAEECLNDVWLSVWKAIPPTKPDNFKAWVGVIARNAALAKLRRRPKLRASPLSELDDCLPETKDPLGAVDAAMLLEAIDAFLRKQPQKQRVAFVRRYWYLDSVGEVADRLGWSVGKTKTTLFRLRNKLAEVLKKEGFSV